MAKTYNRMMLDVAADIHDIITEVQGDQNSRYLDVYLYNNGVPIDLTGHTVRIYMRRPKTNPLSELEEFFNDGEITEAAEGRCQFLMSTQALAKFGHLEAQISIWKGTEEILSTQKFRIMVTENLRVEGEIEGSNEYGSLVILFQNLYEAHDLMTTMVQNIGNPSDIAAQYNLATMWQAWEFLTDYMKTDLTNMIEQALANASVQGVLDKIGATADTGGSATAGTVMGKENAILNKFSSVAGITAQTKQFTNSAVGYVQDNNNFSVTGCGKISLWSNQYGVYNDIILDGNNIGNISIPREAGTVTFYFNSSFSFTAGENTRYLVQT